MDGSLIIPRQEILMNLAWLYWFPNPLFPFIWFRIVISCDHPDLLIEEMVCTGKEK